MFYARQEVIFINVANEAVLGRIVAQTWYDPNIWTVEEFTGAYKIDIPVNRIGKTHYLGSNLGR